MKDADLHTHSYYSDGTDSPRELVMKAKEAGLKTIALTDHNSVQGIKEAIEAGREFGIEIIPGCEFQSDYGEVLGYFFDIDDPGITALNADCHVRKEARVRKFIENLRGIGLVVDYDDLKTKTEGAVQRPHLAKALIDQGFASDMNDAFDRFLVEGTPTFVPVDYPPTVDVIRTIKAAGGIAILAHPWLEQFEKEFAEVDSLIEAGLQGMEIETGPPVKGEDFENRVKKRIKIICEEKGLIMTSGSDYHGPIHKENKLGEHNCDSSVIEELKRRAAALKKS